MSHILAEITEAAVRHNYLPASTRQSTVPEDFYPKEAYGPLDSRKDGFGLKLTLHLPGVGDFEADIDGKKNYRLRDTIVDRFYSLYNFDRGGYIVIEKVGETAYSIFPQRC